MPNRWRIVCAIVTALIVLGAGAYYAKHRTRSYQSSAAFVLVPTVGVTHNDQLAGNVLPTAETSGALGTFVELLAARGPQLTPGYTYTVRAVPDTRAITVDSVGAKAGVQQSLWNLINGRHQAEKLLRDLWTLAVLQTPTAPVAAGPSTKSILGATLALAILAALGVLLLLGKLLPKPAELRGAPGALGGTVEGQLALDAPDESPTAERAAIEAPQHPARP